MKQKISKFSIKLLAGFLTANLFMPMAMASPATDKFRDNLTILRNHIDTDIKKMVTEANELSDRDMTELMTLTSYDYFPQAMVNYLQGCSQQVLGLDALITILGGRPLYPDYTIKYLKDNGFEHAVQEYLKQSGK